MAGRAYPVQQYGNTPPVMNYNQPAYNPGPYPPPPQQYPPPPTASYPMQPGGAYPPASVMPAGPPPPYFPSDPYPHQSPAYPPVAPPTGYPPQQPSVYPPQPHVAPYPPGVQVTGQYDSSARFGAGATHNIPPPPPGVLPNAAQVASMHGMPVQMNKQQAGWLEGHGDGGMSIW